MRVYKEYSPLDKLEANEAREANTKLGWVALGLTIVFIAHFFLGVGI